MMDILLGSDSVGGALVESLGANFTMIAIIFCACFILVLVVLAYRSIKTANNELRLKELQADSRHIEEASKGLIRSDLRRSRVVMKDKERRYLRGIEKDNNVHFRPVPPPPPFRMPLLRSLFRPSRSRQNVRR